MGVGNVPFIYDNGDKVRDKITGVHGTIIGRADYLSGCNRYGVQPVADAGKYVEACWFDEPRIELIEKKKEELDTREERPGADGEAPL